MSVDKIECDDEEERNNVTVDFLNSQTPTGMPLHKLNVKIGAPVMLLRNFNVKNGLCNGTRMIIRNIMKNIIDREVITGSKIGERVFIPRIRLNASDSSLPFKLSRLQLPVRLAYSMTINKSQGQTFDRIGIYLPEPVFTHGQLYVAFSRVRSFEAVKVKIADTISQGAFKNLTGVFTKNVVYTEILTR